MATMLIEKTDVTFAVTEGDKILTEQFHMNGTAVGLRQFRTQQSWNPKMTHRLAHRHAGSGPAHEIVILCRKHLNSLLKFTS
jgi:hypothetical protein